MFKTIAETAKITGLSQHFLYDGCRNGSIPCIKSGKKYLLIPEKVVEHLYSHTAVTNNTTIAG